MRDLNRKKVEGIKPKANAMPRSLRPSGAMVMLKAASRIAIVLVGAAAIGAASGIAARYFCNFILNSPYFAVRSIEVSGAKKLNRAEILRLAGVREGQNIFRVNAQEAVRRIASNPWVKGVTVRRQFPDRVIIRVVERQAMSLVRRSGLWFVEDDGIPFKPAREGDALDMPVICGPGNSDAPDDPDALRRALDVIRLAQGSSILPVKQISEVIISPAGMMSILTTGELERVELGASDLKKQWAILESVLADVKRSGMEAVRVDLNYPAGAAVKILIANSQNIMADRRIANAGQ